MFIKVVLKENLCYHMIGDINGFAQKKKTRLKDFDYSTEGAYFVTICTYKKQCVFSHIVGQGLAPAEIQLSTFGEIVNQELLDLENRYENIKINKYVIMPNHIHLLIRITERINPFPTSRYDIPNVIGKFKAAVTRNVGKAFMPSEKTKI